MNKNYLFLLYSIVPLYIGLTQAFAQNSTAAHSGATDFTNQALELLVQQGITLTSGLLGLGVTALIAWLRRRGIPVSSEQEKMFKDIITKRYESLAKQSWTTIRNNPKKLDQYWAELSKGQIPIEFQNTLKKEGMQFAMELKNNPEFRDFAKNITQKGMEKLTADIRNNLKLNYQKRMIDVIPKLASIAVEAAFDDKVTTVEQWAEKSLENLKPLLLSAEALDTELNLMIVIKSEINKKLQSGWLIAKK